MKKYNCVRHFSVYKLGLQCMLLLSFYICCYSHIHKMFDTSLFNQDDLPAFFFLVSGRRCIAQVGCNFADLWTLGFTYRICLPSGCCSLQWSGHLSLFANLLTRSSLTPDNCTIWFRKGCRSSSFKCQKIDNFRPDLHFNLSNNCLEYVLFQIVKIYRKKENYS